MSKLLKQNDGAGGLILKQNLDGKAMKQNYNIGMAWRNYNSSNAYVRIPLGRAAGFSGPQTIMIIARTVGNGASFFLRGFNISSVTHTPTLGLYDGTHGYFRFLSAFNSTQPMGRVNVMTHMIESGNHSYYNHLNQRVQLLSSQNYIASDHIRLESLGTSASYTLVHGLAIYNRIISPDEYIFRKQNLIFRELLSEVDLFAYYELNKAEKINIAGDDTPAVRDLTEQNNHAPILSLPSGTVDEKVQWANLNCFERW